jgi:ankyrin repeat protein
MLFFGLRLMVNLLLAECYNINLQSEAYGNLLCEASKKGYETTVKLLLDKSTQPNGQGGYYSNALRVASSGGHEQVV